MPELPEVETTVRKLKFLVGKTITGFKSDWPRGVKGSALRFIEKDIQGKRILSASRLGKAIIFALTGGRTLAFHQRMSGRIVVLNLKRIDQSLKLNMEEKHIRVKILFRDSEVLLFHDPRKFGVVWYGTQQEVMRDPYFATLGKDALYISYKEFKDGLRTHKGMIKPILLRQDIFSGIGNIVADETLWEAKIHPQRRAETLKEEEVKKLFSALKYVLKRSIRAQGTTLRDWGHPDGARGHFQKLVRVYGRKGGRCMRCKNGITRIVLGGRGTWLCKACQPLRGGKNDLL